VEGDFAVNSAAFAWLAAGGSLFACLAATGCKSLREFSRRELKEICDRRDAHARFDRILRTRERLLLSVEALMFLSAGVMLLSAWEWLGEPWPDEDPWYYVIGHALLVTFWLLTATSWLPNALARLWSGPILYYGWPFWQAIDYALAPLVYLARFIDALAHRLAGHVPVPPGEEDFEEEIRTVVTAGHREGLIKEDAREMIEGVIDLEDADVTQIMTPRTDMICMPLDRDWKSAAEFITESAHTRIPVYNKTRDNVVGILHAKDLLALLGAPENAANKTLKDILREPMFIPETKAVNELLRDFRNSRNQMAIVLDEYGGVSGLVTIEDVLEEIVGEIVDEYDEELVEDIQLLDPQTAEAAARAHVDEINERLGIELPESNDFDTIGGFVFSELGHVPKVGEEVVWRNVRITVLEATNRRIQRVRIEILDPTSVQ